LFTFFAEKKVNATARHEGRQDCAEKALDIIRNKLMFTYTIGKAFVSLPIEEI
jgi:hypothetical protein